MHVLTWIRSTYDELSGSVEFVNGVDQEKMESELVFGNPLSEDLVKKLKEMNRYKDYFDTDFDMLSSDEFKRNSGRYGTVSTHCFYNKKIDKREVFCMKRIELSSYNELKKVDLHREITIQLGIKDTLNNTKLYHYFWDKSCMFLILPYGGYDLSEITITKDSIFLECISDFVKALHYLHSNKIIHRDIKRANMLYHPYQNSYRLCDYGNAVICNTVRLSLGGGTDYYKAPEMKEKKTFKGYSFPCDLFALGKSLYEIYDGNNFSISGYIKRMRDDDEHKRGTTTEWIKILNIKPVDTKFDTVEVKKFPFTEDEIRNSETIKIINEPDIWKDSVPNGMDRAVKYIQFYESMYGGGGGGDKIEKETKLKKSHSFRNLFGVNKKEKPLLILNNNEIVIDDSIEEEKMGNKRIHDDCIIDSTRTKKQATEKRSNAKVSALALDEYEILKLKDTVIEILQINIKGLTATELYSFIIEKYPKYKTLNVNNLGINILTPMVTDKILNKNTKNKYSLVVKIEI